MRDADRWDRLAPLAGVVFAVLTIISIVLTSVDSPDDFPGEPQEIVDYYSANEGQLMAGHWIGLIGTVFLFWFVGALWSRLRAAEGRAGRVAAVAFGGGVAAGVIGLIIDGTGLIPVLRFEEHDALDPAYASALYDIGQAGVGLMLPGALAVLIGATGVLAIRTGVLPAWLGVVSLILATVLLILPIAWIATLLSLLWVILVSVLLFLSGRATGGVPPADRAPAETGRTSPA